MPKKFRLIPSVLYKQGSVVKSVQYTNHRIVGDLPSTMRVFSRRQADELIIYDLDAAKEKKIDWEMVKVCVENSNMPLTYGGGVYNHQMANDLVAHGFDKISFNTAALENPQCIYKVANLIGSSSTLATVDLKTLNNKMYIFSNSGTKLVREFDLSSEIKFLEEIGVGEVVINSIDRDGSMVGYDLSNFNLSDLDIRLPLLISGGCSGSNCISEAYSRGFDGAVMSSIFLWKGDSIPSLKNSLRDKIPVREIIND